jgi:hypothetical protein
MRFEDMRKLSDDILCLGSLKAVEERLKFTPHTSETFAADTPAQ